jgi:hypothetical protein
LCRVLLNIFEFTDALWECVFDKIRDKMAEGSMSVTNAKEVFPGFVVDVGEGDVGVLVDFVGVAGSVAFLKMREMIPGVNRKGTLVL